MHACWDTDALGRGSGGAVRSKRVYEGYWKDGYKHGRGGVLTKVNKDGFGFELCVGCKPSLLVTTADAAVAVAAGGSRYGTWSFDLPLGRGGMETIRPKTAWGLRDHHAKPVSAGGVCRTATLAGPRRNTPSSSVACTTGDFHGV